MCSVRPRFSYLCCRQLTVLVVVVLVVWADLWDLSGMRQGTSRRSAEDR